MGTTLTGTTPQDTYDSLIKVTDNGPLSATAKYLSDGLGNDSVLALSTSKVGIATNTPAHELHVETSGTGTTSISNVITTLRSKAAGRDINIQFSDGTNQSYVGSLSGAFYVATGGATERMRITSAGNVGIGTSTPITKLSVSDGTNAFHVGHDANGPYISGANNAFTIYKRLSYDATDHLFFSSSTERFRITNNGVTFNGDTAAANALDDYEEGTWTPSQGSGLVVVGAFSSTGSYTKIGRMVVVRGVLTGATSVAATSNQEIATNLPFTAATIFTGTIMNDAANASGGIYVNGGAVIITTTFSATPSLYFSATYFV